jgi:glycerol-3-phosphate dehydrogenase
MADGGTLVTFDRADALRRLDAEQFDVLVVGGGITGAGVALDAASRGLRTGLVERHDFASGTSSKSSKLVHGGLRYLQQGDVRLVYEALHERQRLRRNAPHLVKVLPFLIPLLSRDGLLNPKVARALGLAMWMYDLTGGARIGQLHQRLSRDEAMTYMPTLREDRLAGAYLYYDAYADDARLTLTIARTAVVVHGAVLANWTGVTGFVKDGSGRVTGAQVRTAEGDELVVHASVVVNATGVWADDVRALDEGSHPESIRPAKGVHVAVPWSKVRNTIAVVVPVPKDKRSVFVVPWPDGDDGDAGGVTYIGTTDTDYDGDPDDPQCTPEDIAYVLGAINVAAQTALTASDVLGTWAGLRPLVKAGPGGRTADLSRRHQVRPSAGGVVTVTGGKLTTYREMAADTVDAAAKVLGRRVGKTRTGRMPLLGADGYEMVLASAGSDTVLRHLADRYGDEARSVLTWADGTHGDPTLRQPLVPGLPYLRAEAVHAVRREMARTIDDVLARRTRARLLARDASAAAADDVAALIGPDLGWDEAEQQRQAALYRASVDHERSAPGLPETAVEASSLLA